MSHVVFEMPNQIVFGEESIKKLGEISKRFGKKALIVGDSMMAQLGYVKLCQEVLLESGVESALYLEVNREPDDGFVTDGLKVFKDNNCDVIVAVGGGSPIDTAKAIAVVATNGGYIGDYIRGQKIASIDPVPLIAIPTTAGTGSEATNVTVITNTETTVKMMIKQTAFLPKIAIVDPYFTLSSPKHVTASTGVDALCHAIESYVSRIANPLTKEFSLAAIKLIMANLETAYVDGSNVKARELMALGATEAGIAFSNASVALVHGMSRPIGAIFHVPHGISNAMLLPAFLDYTKPIAVKEFAEIGRTFLPVGSYSNDEEWADAMVDAIKELCVKLGIGNLRSWGIDKDEFAKVVDKMATDAIASGSPGNNPIVPTHEEIVELYWTCYTYGE